VIVPLKLHNTSYATGTGIPGGLHGYGWNSSSKRFDDKTLFSPSLAERPVPSSPTFLIY
jgi:hypothetical protein